MDKKSKILLIIFFGAIFASVGFTYYKIFILQDYYIRMKTTCDPAKEKCFVWVCDPADDSECPANVDERISYYKYIEKKAYAILVCDAENDECPEINCVGDPECQETLCDASTVAEGETCNDPATYIPLPEASEIIPESEINNQEASSTEAICEIDSESCTTTEETSPEVPIDNLEL